MTGAVSVPKALASYITVDEEGIRLNPQKTGELAVALLILPEKMYLSWCAMFPAGLDKALNGRLGATRRLFFLVEGMPAKAHPRIRDGKAGVYVFFSGYTSLIPHGEWIDEPPEALPIIAYTDIRRLVGDGPKLTTQTAHTAGEVVTSPEPPARPKSEPWAAKGIFIPDFLKNVVCWGYAKVEITYDAKGKKHVGKVPCDRSGNARAQAANLVTAYEIDYSIIDNVNYFLALSLGGSVKGKTEGERAYIPRPAPIVIFDYDHVRNPETGDYAEGIPQSIRNEIEWLKKTTFCAYSVSEEGLHAFLFDNLPESDEKITPADQLPEIFRGDKFTVFTGNKCPESPNEVCNVDISGIFKRQGEYKKKPAKEPEKTAKASKAGTKSSKRTNGEFHPPGVTPDQSAEWNQRFDAVDICCRNGYKLVGERLLYPHSETKNPGVLIQEGGKKVYSNHAGDPLNDGYPHDAYDCVRILECGGDPIRAGHQILQDLGKSARQGRQEATQSAKNWWDGELRKVAIGEVKGMAPDMTETFTRIPELVAIEAAEAAVSAGDPYEAYVTPDKLHNAWECSEAWRICSTKNATDPEYDKIITAAVEMGKKKYNEFSQKARERVKGETPKEQPEYTPEQAEEARKIWERGEMLEYLIESCHVEHVGEDTMLRMMLLSAAGINVVNSEGIHISVSGAAGTGKSHAAKVTIKRLPKRMILDGGLSDKALFYHNIPDGTIIIMDDRDMTEELQSVMKVATTSWDEPATHRTVMNGKAVALQTPARSLWWVIKANTTGDEQVLDRQVSLWADDSKEQKAAIRREITRQECNPDAVEQDHGICKALWDQLPTAAVMIPFPDNIGMGDNIEPRNQKLFFDIIKSYALLHAPKRENDEAHGWIIAKKEDFVAACNLFNPLIHGKGGSQIHKLTPDEQKVLDVMAAENKAEWTYTELARALQMSKNRVIRAIKGRHDGRHDDIGLEGKTSMIDVVDTSEEVETTSKRRRGATILWHAEAYEVWKHQSEQGFYWQETDRNTL